MPPKILTKIHVTWTVRMPTRADTPETYMRIGSDDLERFRDLFRSGAAANIQKVCRLASVKLYDVHRGHGQPGAVDWR